VLSTIHAAKELEWEAVAVVGLNGRSFGTFDPSPEEARLFYVAATRAKQDLMLFTQDGDLPFEVES
jgi:superfamily I DNA/RNA helicase